MSAWWQYLKSRPRKTVLKSWFVACASSVEVSWSTTTITARTVGRRYRAFRKPYTRWDGWKTSYKWCAASNSSNNTSYWARKLIQRLSLSTLGDIKSRRNYPPSLVGVEKSHACRHQKPANQIQQQIDLCQFFSWLRVFSWRQCVEKGLYTETIPHDFSTNYYEGRRNNKNTFWHKARLGS